MSDLVKQLEGRAKYFDALAANAKPGEQTFADTRKMLLAAANEIESIRAALAAAQAGGVEGQQKAATPDMQAAYKRQCDEYRAQGFAAGIEAAAQCCDRRGERWKANDTMQWSLANEAFGCAIDIRDLLPPAAAPASGADYGQLFVVLNPKSNTVYIFDNHDAALRCRTELKLDHWHLWGQVVSSDWKDGQPIRSSGITPGDR